ncbi:MAG: hypothetical protein GY782_08645 [Gammaproteobacteria bacterium]|nr:hypothetical protein [Gammaproteobacteria bacterium]
MTEQEYCDLSDLQLLRAVTIVLQMVSAFEDPNKARLKSVIENIYLMIKNLEEQEFIDE